MTTTERWVIIHERRNEDKWHIGKVTHPSLQAADYVLHAYPTRVRLPKNKTERHMKDYSGLRQFIRLFAILNFLWVLVGSGGIAYLVSLTEDFRGDLQPDFIVMMIVFIILAVCSLVYPVLIIQVSNMLIDTAERCQRNERDQSIDFSGLDYHDD